MNFFDDTRRLCYNKAILNGVISIGRIKGEQSVIHLVVAQDGKNLW